KLNINDKFYCRYAYVLGFMLLGTSETIKFLLYNLALGQLKFVSPLNPKYEYFLNTKMVANEFKGTTTTNNDGKNKNPIYYGCAPQQFGGGIHFTLDISTALKYAHFDQSCFNQHSMNLFGVSELIRTETKFSQIVGNL